MFGLSLFTTLLIFACITVAVVQTYRLHGLIGVLEYTNGLVTQARNECARLQDANSTLRETNVTYRNHTYELEKEVGVLTAKLNQPVKRYKNAEEALADILSDGPCVGADCIAEMDARGYSESSTYMAKSSLNVTSKKVDGEFVWFPKGTSESDYSQYALGTVGNPGGYGETAQA